MKQWHYGLLIIILANQLLFGLITDNQSKLADAIKNAGTQILTFIDLVDKTELNEPCTQKISLYRSHDDVII
jgi:hypothetical protein